MSKQSLFIEVVNELKNPSKVSKDVYSEEDLQLLYAISQDPALCDIGAYRYIKTLLSTGKNLFLRKDLDALCHGLTIIRPEIPIALQYVKTRVDSLFKDYPFNYLVWKFRYEIKPYADVVFENESGQQMSCLEYLMLGLEDVDTLIDETTLVVPCRDYVIGYVPKEDMILYLPTDIGRKFTTEMMSKVICDGEGFKYEDVPIRTLCGHLGITRYEADLREVI